MMISGILRHVSWLGVFMILIGLMPLQAQGAYDIHKEIPLRFNYRAANTGGFEAASPWIWLGGIVESKIYFSKMNVPTAISIPAKLIMECQKGDIWPGNMAACRAWIESQDDPDVPELWSNYGYTLGVKFRDWFTETELADVGKDFAMKINKHGAMPLGTNLICGIDYLEYASFPISEFIPDTKAIQKVAKQIIGAAGIGTVRLAGELVVEGNYVELNIADATLKFLGFRNSATYPDPANDPNVKTFALTVPSAEHLEDSPIYNAESKTLFYEPIIQYSLNLYNTAGLEFSLIGPLHFNFMPTVVTKGTNLMSYACPDLETLHNGNYYNKPAVDFKISSERPLVVSFPLTDTPNLPDIAITEVRFNDVPDGEVFADEWTSIVFTITNIGERDTVISPEPIFMYSLFLDGQPLPDDDPTLGYAMINRWIDDVPQDLYKGPLVVLAKNASHRVGAFTYKFTEGPHKLEISTGYNEYKTTQNGWPVYGIGDYHVANNYKIARQFYAQPKRGTVLGRIITNPCGGDCGVNGIQVCLKDGTAGGYYECQVTRNIDGQEGAYRFVQAPTGDYTLEYRPTPPTAAQIVAGATYYAPRSFSFHHDGQDTDDFNYNTSRSGMAIFQYQALKGYVKDQSIPPLPIQGVVVQLGIAGVGPFGPAVTTNASGLFTFSRSIPIYDGNGQLISSSIPPKGDYTLTFRHDLYQPKEIQFHLGVVDSAQTETVVTNYYFDPEVNPNGSTSGPVKLTLDSTAPTLTIHPLANEGYGSSTLNLQFLASDTNGKQVKQYRYTVYYGTSGTTHATPSEWFPYPDADAANPDALVSVTASIGAPLAEGQHRLRLEVRDGAIDGSNITASDLNFTKDTGAPMISSVGFKDPVTSLAITTTTSRQVNVTVTLTNAESGPLKAWLSNDSVTWNGPFTFTGTTTTILQWALTELEAYVQTGHKVYVKVRDLAGNESNVAQGTINVDTSGAVRLANGADYFSSANVPLSIDISPPPGTPIFSETGAGTKINIGNTADTQYRAQTITLDTAKTFNFIELFMSYAQPPPVTGTPGPLKIKIVSQLPAADPSVSNSANAALVKAQWSFPAADVTSLVKTYGHLPVLLPVSLTLSAGTYYLLMYTDAVDANNYYSKATGYYSLYTLPPDYPEYHERFDFIPAQSVWLQQRDIMSIYTLTYKFWDNQQGQIRIAANGNCGSAAWINYLFPATAQRFVDFSGINNGSGAGLGLQTVCVEYKHPTIHTKDGLYYDSVIIDAAAPSGTVVFRSVEKDAKTLYLDLSATDTFSGVESFVWKAGGTWSMPEPYAPTLRIPNLSVDTVEVKFIDKAGNESPVYAVTLPQDIFAPNLLSFRINDGSGFTTNPLLTFHVNATDNRNLAGIVYRETVTGAKGEITVTGTTYNPDPPDSVTLPKVKVNANGTEEWLDGVYQYTVQARDAAGNRSMARQATMTLDRQAPTIRNFYLKGFDGRALTTVPAFQMVLDVQDAFGPLLMRHSFNNTTWTVWQAIEPREITLRIDAPTPMPANYTLYIQVKDGAGNTTSAQAGIRTNRPPATPVSGSPSGATFTDSPRIAPSPFYDADGDTLEAVWFIVRKSDDQTVIVNTMPLYGSTGYTLSSLDLSYNVGYTWSARYLDSFGQWSSWSNPVTFILKRPTLTVNKTGYGRIMSGGGQIDCGADCSAVYDPGYSLVLTATPDTGYVFAGWSGACAGTANCRIVMDADKTVTASFAPAAAPLRGDLDGSGKVDLADAVVALRIQVRFYPTPVALSADVNVDGKIGLPEAMYVLQVLSGLRETSLPALAVVKSGNGTGTVTSNPAGIDCGTDCSETYTDVTAVTLTAVPDPGSSTFAGWLGACTGTGNCSVTVDAVKTVGATFALIMRTITPSAGTGGTIAPATSVTVDHGSGMTFTITPATGYHVTDVLVDGVSVGAVTTYAFTNVTAAHTIVASFAPNVTTFTIMASAGDYGAISPLGATTVNQGAGKTYTITPQAGYHVVHVYVDDIDAGPVTSYTFSAVTANHTIHAVFEADVTFASSDLALGWSLAGIATGSLMTASYGGIEFDADGRATDGTLTYPEQEAQQMMEGSLRMDSQGILSEAAWVLDLGTTLTILSGKMTEAKDFMTFVGQSSLGSLELMMGMKYGIAILPTSAADLSGTWNLFGYRAGNGKDGGALKGSLVLNDAGEVSAASSLTFPDKTTLSVKGSLMKGLDVNVDILTLNSGQIDAGRSLMMFTDAGTTAHDFFLAVKDGGAFPRGFLEGTWYVTGLSSGTTWRGFLTMTGEGLVTGGTLIDGKNQAALIGGGEIDMDSAGLISKSTLTLAGDATLGIDRGKMTTDGNMIVWIMETPPATPGLVILTRWRDQR